MVSQDSFRLWLSSSLPSDLIQTAPRFTASAWVAGASGESARRAWLTQERSAVSESPSGVSAVEASKATSISIMRAPPGRRLLDTPLGGALMADQSEMGSNSDSDMPLTAAAVRASNAEEATAASMVDAAEAANGE